MTVRMISPAGHPGDIHPDEVAHMLVHGWMIVPAAADEPSDADNTSAMSDGELRDAIKELTGTAPHHKTGRAKLIEKYEAAQSGGTEN